MSKTAACPLTAPGADAPKLPRKMAILDSAGELRAMYPQLARVASPLPATRWEGRRWNSNPILQLGNRVRAGLHRLSLRSTPEGLVGPIEVQGYCLGRLVMPGDRVWIDPARLAGDWSLVAIVASNAWMTSTIARLVHEPAFCEAHGNALPNVWLKLLRHVNGRRLVFEAGGAGYLENFRVLGVVAHVERDGRAI